jgi:hypothetical protein
MLLALTRRLDVAGSVTAEPTDKRGDQRGTLTLVEANRLGCDIAAMASPAAAVEL